MISEGNLKVSFISHNRPPNARQNPDYPHGSHIDSHGGERPACHVDCLTGRMLRRVDGSCKGLLAGYRDHRRRASR